MKKKCNLKYKMTAGRGLPSRPKGHFVPPPRHHHPSPTHPPSNLEKELAGDLWGIVGKRLRSMGAAPSDRSPSISPAKWSGFGRWEPLPSIEAVPSLTIPRPEDQRILL